jgi:hypothetical protein
MMHKVPKASKINLIAICYHQVSLSIGIYLGYHVFFRGILPDDVIIQPDTPSTQWSRSMVR